MKKVVIYTSDHGLGHASRTIALVRNLLERKKLKIIIKNYTAYDFLKTNLPNIQVQKIRTDVGPIYDWTSNRIDVNSTFESYLQFIKNEERWISKESQSFEAKPDLIISDISPMATRLAEHERCPSVTIANFSWVDILEELPPKEQRKDVLAWLRESFGLSDLAIKVPLAMKLKGFSKIKDASLLARDSTKTTKRIMSDLGLNSSPITSYLGDFDARLIAKSHPVDIIRLRHNGILLNNKKIRTGFYEGQNIISASRLVIAKIGYGIISDCLKFRKPMILISRSSYPENEVLRKEVRKFSIAKVVDYLDSENGIEIPDDYQIREMSEKIDESAIAKLEKREDASKLVSEFL